MTEAYPKPPRAGLGSSTTTGARGERQITLGLTLQLPRPTGTELKHLLEAMTGIGYPNIPPSGFDVVEIPCEAHEEGFTFLSRSLVSKWCEQFTFLEIKTCTQERVDGGFGQFLFSFPEAEIRAAEILGSRHVVVLYNRNTGQTLRTSIPELLERASSKTWQLTVQLAPTGKIWDGPSIFDLFGDIPDTPPILELFSEPTEPPSTSHPSSSLPILDMFGE